MTLSTFQASVQDSDGNILPGAQIDVFIESSGARATIYSTRAGAVLSNPFFADADGFFQFYANATEYRITATSGVFSRTFRYEALGDGAARDVQVSLTDATVGRVMLTGAFGLGATSLPDQAGLDANAITALGWNYVSSPINGPTAGTTKFFTMPSTIGTGRGSQWGYPVNADEVWYRTQKSSATWSAWQRTDPQAFGVGKALAQDWNAIPAGGYFNQSNVNSATGFDSGISSKINGSQGFQIAGDTGNGIWARSGISVDTEAWQPVYTGANLVKAQNVSGGTVLASGTTAGANLVPAQSGNWSPATDTINNARNLWVKQ